MGQQSPFLPNAQSPYGQTMPQSISGMQPQPYALPGYGAVAPPTANNLPGLAQQGANPTAPPMAGVDPAMMAAAQQSLANPDAGDINSILPSPRALAEGAVAGGAVAVGMKYLTDKNVFNTAAGWLDRVPGSNQLRDFVDKQIRTQGNAHPALKEFLMPDAHLLPNAPQAEVDSAIASTMAHMEQNQLKNVLGPYQKRFAKQTDAIKSEYARVLDKTGHLPEHNYLTEFAKDQMVDPKANLSKVIIDLDKQLEHLKGLDNKTQEQKALYKTLRQVKERVSGINEFYKPLYQSQVELTAKLSAKGVGPIGRCFAGFTNYIQRIFNGSTMGMGETEAAKAAEQNVLQKGWGLTKKAFGPMLVGLTIFGFSFHAAHNAKDGEKKKTFFHNLLGSQIFNFIGWEFGRKLLNSFQFGSKIFGRAAGKTLPGFLSKIPLLGSITLAGFGTEMVAMFLFGSMFQKVGEKLSNAIFGRPSQASIDGKGNSPNQPTPGNPALAGQGNPALSGMINPAWMSPAMQPQIPTAVNPAWGAALGGQLLAAQNPAAQPQFVSQTQSGTLQPRTPTPAMQARAPQPRPSKFSLTPDQIRNSKVASDADGDYQNLKADKTLDKRPGKLLDRF